MKTFGAPQTNIVYKERPGAYGFWLDEQGRLAVVRIPGGLFLPGGGVEPGEALATALAREFVEELGARVLHAEVLGEAAQYHRSVFYGADFKKIGTFFRVDAELVPGAVPARDHQLEWMDVARATQSLSQEFQRWATAEFL